MSASGRLVGRIRGREFGVLALELVLLVAGILFALALDRRIQTIEENEIATSALLTLRSDLDGVLEQIRDFRINEAERLSASVVAYSALEEEQIPRTAETWESFFALTGRRTLALPRTGYDELLTTGGLRFLGPSLRTDISRYYELLIRDQSIVARNNATFTDEMAAPFLVGEGMLFLTVPDSESAIGVVAEANRVRAEAGVPVGPTYRGRIWETGPDDPDRIRAQATAAQIGVVAAIGRVLADGIEARTLELIDEVDRVLGEN